MKLFKIKIINIEILPFGSIINTYINYNLNSNKILLISLGGIINQLLLYLIYYGLFRLGFINNISYGIFLYYNRLIILFNMFPIIPLDGSKALLSILERIFSYKLSLKIINILSLISIIIFILVNKISFNLILLGLFLFYKTYLEILNNNYIFKRFLLERYLDNKTYYKVKNINKIDNIYKNKYNFINNVREGDYLKKIFDIEAYF